MTYHLPVLQVIGPELNGVLEPAESVAVVAPGALVPSQTALREAITSRQASVIHLKVDRAWLSPDEHPLSTS